MLCFHRDRRAGPRAIGEPGSPCARARAASGACIACPCCPGACAYIGAISPCPCCPCPCARTCVRASPRTRAYACASPGCPCARAHSGACPCPYARTHAYTGACSSGADCPRACTPRGACRARPRTRGISHGPWPCPRPGPIASIGSCARPRNATTARTCPGPARPGPHPRALCCLFMAFASVRSVGLLGPSKLE